MTCCCLLNENSPCTIDESIKVSLVDGGVTAPIYAGALAHSHSGPPYMVLELLNPTNPRLDCECLRYDSILQIRIYTTVKQEGVSLAKQAIAILKAAAIESQVANARLFRSTPATQVHIPDGVFLTRVNASLVVWSPK